MAMVLPGAARRLRAPATPVGLTGASVRSDAGASVAARARNSLDNESASTSTGTSPQRGRICASIACGASTPSRGV
jgi:hypothetical protein